MINVFVVFTGKPLQTLQNNSLDKTRFGAVSRRWIHRTASYQRTSILRQYCSLSKILRCCLTFDKERFRLILQGHKRNVRTVRVWSSQDRGER